MTMSNHSTDEARKVGNKSTGVFHDLSSGERAPAQNSELPNKTRQNNAHQHTEAANSDYDNDCNDRLSR